MLARDLAAASVAITFTSPDEDTWPGILPPDSTSARPGAPGVRPGGPRLLPEHLLAAQVSVDLGT